MASNATSEESGGIRLGEDGVEMKIFHLKVTFYRLLSFSSGFTMPFF
jgi:hypothetical protein